MSENNDGFTTRAVHHARGVHGTTGAVMPPIYMTSTFEHGNPDGFDYTRSGNPNFRLLDEVVASMEGSRYATCFASGVSAITSVVSTLKSGDLILAEQNVYGCTYRLLERVFSKFGLRTQYVDLSRETHWIEIRKQKPALVWIESPTNPLLKVLDIAGLSQEAQRNGIPILVDNTFASPYLQQPIQLGATLSLSSATKYINGHSDCLSGAVATNDPEWHERMVFAQKALGLQPSPFDAWLTSRGQKTLALRMERHCSNALALAEWLEKRPEVAWVRYPWLPSHPQYSLARKQMRGGSGIVIIELKCGCEQALAFCKRLRLFTMAESLGGVESLICHPATMTHASIPPDVRLKTGIFDAMVRLSVGIEECNDLKGDLEQALATIPV